MTGAGSTPTTTQGGEADQPEPVEHSAEERAASEEKEEEEDNAWLVWDDGDAAAAFASWMSCSNEGVGI